MSELGKLTGTTETCHGLRECGGNPRHLMPTRDAGPSTNCRGPREDSSFSPSQGMIRPPNGPDARCRTPRHRANLAIFPEESDPRRKSHRTQDSAENKTSPDTGLCRKQTLQDTGLRRKQNFARFRTRRKLELSSIGQEYCSVVFSLRTQTFRITP